MRSTPTTLRRMTSTTPTAWWNDSGSIYELTGSIDTNGTVGATCDTVMVLSVKRHRPPTSRLPGAW